MKLKLLRRTIGKKALYFLNKQEDFLRTYLDGWVAPFCEKMRQGTENEFYQALADCVSVFMTKTDRCAMPEELRENLARV